MLAGVPAEWQTLAGYLRAPILETIGISAGALAIALALGVPAALVMAAGGLPGRVVRLLATLVRAVPDLVLAIVFVVAVGLGPVPGTLALGLSGAATIAKLFTELLESVRREPYEALRATGATPLAAFLVGRLPAAWPGLVGFTAYQFESIARSSVIVGVVGAGGLGAAIMQSVNVLEYDEAYAALAALVVLVVVVDALSGFLRSRGPVWLTLASLAALFAIGAAAFEAAGGVPWETFLRAFPRLFAYAARAFPPALNAETLAPAWRGIVETLGVALVGTLAGALAAIPVALLSARAVASGWMRGTGYRPWSIPASFVLRGLTIVARAVPPVALALVGVQVFGVGPRAGAVVLAVHTTGVLGKLFAESLEVVDLHAAEALVAGGSTGLAAVATAIVPDALPAAASHLLYRWEWNVRASTTLGIVGAGGLGQQIFNAQQLFHDRALLAYVLCAIALVLVSDAASSLLRGRLALRSMVR